MLFGVVIPFAEILVLAVLMLAWRTELPEPLAAHWGPSDVPDGFMPFATYLTVSMVTLAFIPLALTGTVMWQLRAGSWGVVHRLLIAVTLATTTMLAFIMAATVLIQRGLTDAVLAPGVTQWMIAGSALGIAAGAGAFFLQPRGTVMRVAADDPPPLAPSSGGEVPREWMGTSTTPGAIRWVIFGVTLAVWIIAILVALGGEPPTWVPVMLGVVGTVMVVVLIVGLGSFETRVSATGVRVRSAMGLQIARIPIAEIADVRTSTVEPFAEFGGWGYRISPDGRRGIVTRAGEALEITRTNGKVFVVTVDDAHTGARVLRAHLDKHAR